MQKTNWQKVVNRSHSVLSNSMILSFGTGAHPHPTRRFDTERWEEEKHQEQQTTFEEVMKDNQNAKMIMELDDPESLKTGAIQSINASQYPFSTLGMVRSLNKQGNLIIGTGCIIASNIILTSASNIYDIASKTYNSQIKFFPGPLLSSQHFEINFVPADQPIGANEVYYSCFVPQELNYGLILTNPKCDLQSYFGSLNYRFQDQPQPTQDVAKNISIYGFSVKNNGFISNSVQSLNFQNIMVYKNQLDETSNGSPVIQFQQGQYYVKGIHQNFGNSIGFTQKLNRQMFYNLETKIQSYRLGCKQIQDCHLPQIIQSINSKSEHLTILNLEDNRIGPEGCQKLFKYQWRNLIKLFLNKNMLGGQGCKFLSLAKMYRLQLLNIAQNNIGDSGCQSLALGKWFNLRCLNLSQNNIRDGGCKYLSTIRLEKLLTLDLSRNSIKDEGCRFLSLGDYPHIKILRIQSRSHQGLIHISKTNWKLTQLHIRAKLMDFEFFNCEIFEKWNFQRIWITKGKSEFFMRK